MTDILSDLEAKASKADLAIINNDQLQSYRGHIYVKRGGNECCVARPECPEWAVYIAALIKHGPSLLKIARAAQRYRAGLAEYHRKHAEGDPSALCGVANLADDEAALDSALSSLMDGG